MLKLETAKKLKLAGLEWEPQEGDYILYPDGELTSILTCGDVAFEDLEGCVFAPRLDQLLAEIENRGYAWKLQKFSGCSVLRMELYIWDKYWGYYESESPEEAAALALLWILSKEVTA